MQKQHLFLFTEFISLCYMFYVHHRLNTRKENSEYVLFWWYAISLSLWCVRLRVHLILQRFLPMSGWMDITIPWDMMIVGFCCCCCCVHSATIQFGARLIFEFHTLLWLVIIFKCSQHENIIVWVIFWVYGNGKCVL